MSFRPPPFSALRRLFFLFCLLLLGSASVRSEEVLRVGVMPFNSQLALLRFHQPLREHLQARLGIPVEIRTSPDFPAYVKDVLGGRFDVIVLAPHFAVLAYQDAGYRPLFHYRNTLEPLLVVRRDSPIDSPADMRGRTVAVASKLALVSIVGLQRFRQEGVPYPQAIKLDERVTHGTAIAAVAVGEVDAALSVETTLRQVPPDVREKLRAINLGVSLPHLVTMANASLGDERIARLRAALAAFPETEAGRRFFVETGYGGYDPFTREDIRQLQPYADVVRQLLGEERKP